MGRLSSCCPCPCPRPRPRASCWRLGCCTRPSRGAVEPSPTRESRPSRGGLATTTCSKIGVSPLSPPPLLPANASRTLMLLLTGWFAVMRSPSPRLSPHSPRPRPQRRPRTTATITGTTTTALSPTTCSERLPRSAHFLHLHTRQALSGGRGAPLKKCTECALLTCRALRVQITTGERGREWSARGDAMKEFGGDAAALWGEARGMRPCGEELRGGLSLGLGGHRSAAARGLGVDIN